MGRRIRLRRRLLKISQEALGQAIGVTFQQIQKYEKGQNRVGCGRLWDFADALRVDISFFFEDLEGIDSLRTLVPRVQAETEKGASQSPIPGDPVSRTETLELCQAFWQLKPGAREAFLHFLTAASRIPASEGLEGDQDAA
ncbi:helix-turn-helix domain-containing protein [Rhodospirillum sp. A1_3_36]|uniref:helix-turn-helix domain-containing protein n=1 Tax=Rhodospirillum sp. A1_3_36 TaxID=3391666 RepID=UPI0039A4D563